MKIRVKLFANLRIDNEKEMLLDMPEEATPMDIIQQLDISEDDAKIIMINGRSKELDATLYEGDIVSIFPPVGGG